MRVQACHGERAHDVCWDDRDSGSTHISLPHALLVPFDLLRSSLQCDLARDVPRRRLGLWAEGFRVAAKESGVGGESMGRRLRGTHYSGGTCHVARYQMR